MTSNTYVPNDRVWVLVDGYDWWPARVLSDDEIDSVLGTRRAGCDVAVVFYRGTTTEPSVYELNSIADADHICYFETSSEKAVTLSEDLRSAIRHASEDTNANPLKLDSMMISTHVGGSSSNAANMARADRKRSRQEMMNSSSNTINSLNKNVTSLSRSAQQTFNSHDRTYNANNTRYRSNNANSSSSFPSSSSASAGQSSTAYRHLTIEKLSELAAEINAAVNEHDVNTLRLVLCKLENVDVDPKELEKSKIGVAVGNMIGSHACKPLWPLAKALISFWARHLPNETLRAIRSLQENTRGQNKFAIPAANKTYYNNTNTLSSGNMTNTGNSSNNNVKSAANGNTFINTNMPLSPSSPLYPLSPHSPLSPSQFGVSFNNPLSQSQSSQFNSPASPTTVAASQKSTFYSALCRFLDNPSESTPTDSQVIERVARDFAKNITSRDDRHILLSRLNNPELGFVRENLLSGKWDVAQYLQQPDEAFKTQRQKSEETMRLRRRIEAEEAAKRANVNLTTLFTCPNCHKNRCHYYEQQTRSADEPTTKFITCLECKNVWTQE